MSARERKASGSSRSAARFCRPMPRKIAGWCCSFPASAHGGANWRGGRARPLDLYDLKGALDALGLGPLRWERTENANFALAAGIYSETTLLGVGGQLSSAHRPAVAAAAVLVAEITLPNELEIASRHAAFSRVAAFPLDQPRHRPARAGSAHPCGDRRDDSRAARAIVRRGAAFRSVQRRKAVGAGRKSLAYSLTYQDKNRTLTHDEVNRGPRPDSRATEERTGRGITRVVLWKNSRSAD